MINHTKESLNETAMNLIELVSFLEPDFILSDLLGCDQKYYEIYQKKALARVWKAMNKMDN